MSIDAHPIEPKQAEKAVGYVVASEKTQRVRLDTPLATLPAGAVSLNLLGVDYTHIKTSSGGDLYLTRYGRPFWEQLLPENWFAKEWFETKRQRLVGTSTVYKIPTRHIRNTSLQLVVKWSRVGEEVPYNTLTINKFIQAEFNSPFEEFSLVMELRAGLYGPPGIRLLTQKPLAIYVPSKKLHLWQTGRSESKIAAKLAQHPGIELDILRQYVVLFGWIEGLDIVQAADQLQLAGDRRDTLLSQTTSLITHELELKGYRVIDMKPAHLIVRPQPDGHLLRDRNDQIACALVDYELLERTPEHEQTVRKVNRQHYLQRMARRFEVPSGNPMPPHLRLTQVLGVDYVFGRAVSTGGLLWVVGKDPYLFNYFLPERWRRTPKLDLSGKDRVFYTCTKDNINLVWRVSRLGDSPECGKTHPNARAIAEFGFNSPFEEFAFALELGKAGIKTVYPRAIYMTGHKAKRTQKVADPRRYKKLEHLRTPDGQPALCKDHDYITIWGFWNGPDELLACHDGEYYQSINARQAWCEGLIPSETLQQLSNTAQQQLNRANFEHLDFRPEHYLLSLASNHTLVRDPQGNLEVRLCNLELIRSIGSQTAPP